MTIGQRLKEARLAAGLSQRQLCGDTITRNMLSQIENGVARPSMETLQALAKRLNKPISFFLDEGNNPNETALQTGRECFRRGVYLEALKALNSYQAEESRPEEYQLLKALCSLKLAEEAVAQGRLPYAVSLLADCAAAGQQTVYFTPELERRRLVLLAKASPEEAEGILVALPPDDDELLLRAQMALDRQDGALAGAILDAAQDQKSNQWLMLRGQAAVIREEYRFATEYFRRAEQAGSTQVYGWLEQCYRQLEDYKMAYHYACKQK